MHINDRLQIVEAVESNAQSEKVRLEDILAPFKVSNSELFKSYLKEIGQVKQYKLIFLPYNLIIDRILLIGQTIRPKALQSLLSVPIIIFQG